MSKFSEYIRQERKKQGIKGYEIAEQIGYTSAGISNFELRSKDCEPLVFADLICKLLNITYQIGVEERPGGTPDKTPFIDMFRQEYERYDDINLFLTDCGISSRIVRSVIKYDNLDHRLQLKTANKICKKWGINYVIGSGCNFRSIQTMPIKDFRTEISSFNRTIK